jgi:hypothetical protein
VAVRDHDFPDEVLGKITPYGVYDIAANRGFCSVGTSCDTAAFAVNALRSWWQREGASRYPGAGRLLVICDAGGSNGYRCRLWKDQLAVLAAETGLQITVMHFPPGTSKWNKIEHRLFCHITRTWRARPLMTAAGAVAGIAATVTSRGLKCTAVLDDGDYPAGVKVSGERMSYLENRVLDRAAVRGEWNYTVLPSPRPAPQPQPAPAPAGRCPQAVLNHPALTGMDPAALDALATALDIPFAARREQRNYTQRGHRRRNAVRNSDGSNGRHRLDLTDHLITWRLREHLHLPTAATRFMPLEGRTVVHACGARCSRLPRRRCSPGHRRLGTAAFMHAAGITCSQRLGDLVGRDGAGQRGRRGEKARGRRAMTPLAVFAEIIDASGITPRIEAMLPADTNTLLHSEDEPFYGYYLSAGIMMPEENGPAAPELARRATLSSCRHDRVHYSIMSDSEGKEFRVS